MIRAGLIGFGMAGRVFHGPLLSSVEGIELAAVMERTSNKGTERYPGIVTYRTVEEMLADSSLGLFVVATPNQSHFEIARKILLAGKNVVVDKPMALRADEITELILLAAEKNVLLAPFHNRRWDSDFLTIQKVLHEGVLGRLVALESRFDRWRPAPPTPPTPYTDRLWKEDPASGGTLLDLGPHLADQALALFGKPEAVSAEVAREKDGPAPNAGPNDSFTIRLRYPRLTVTLGANALSLPPGPRFRLRGTKGNYVKLGLDPQEAALNRITRIADPHWGREPESAWGTLHVDIGGGTVSRPVEPAPGDYRLYYAGIRDALLGKAKPPVSAADAWRAARLLEWAQESSEKRREIPCDWSGEATPQVK